MPAICIVELRPASPSREVNIGANRSLSAWSFDKGTSAATAQAKSRVTSFTQSNKAAVDCGPNAEALMAPLFWLTLRFGKGRELTLAIWWPLT